MSATVLIADRNIFLIEALESTLSLLGFTVVGKTSVNSNIETLALRTKPDLLVYDMHLSDDGNGGLVALKGLKGKLPEMKTLATGFIEVSDQFAAEFLNAGFDGYWSKSGHRDELTRSLKVLFP